MVIITEVEHNGRLKMTELLAESIREPGKAAAMPSCCVYDTIDRDVGKRLRQINLGPHKGRNHHQWLKEFGKAKLIGQIQSVITIMKLSTDREDFKRKFAKVFATKLR